MHRWKAGMTLSLAGFSDSMAAIVAHAAPMVLAIRVGPNRHITGVHWRPDTVVSPDQPLPPQDAYTLVRPNGALTPARGGAREQTLNLACLRLDAPHAPPAMPMGHDAPVGSLVLVVGADFDGSPTARLAGVHRRARPGGIDGPGPVLDPMGVGALDQGGIVLDMTGRVLGMAAIGPSGLTVIVPHDVIGRFLDPGTPQRVASPDPAPAISVAPRGGGSRRGWLGIALQPITVPEALVARTGQSSGRMVVNITAGGPAEKAGLRTGDVLLALNGHGTSGSHALRAFLAEDRIGSQIEVKLLRDGAVLTTFLTVAAQPG